MSKTRKEAGTWPEWVFQKNFENMVHFHRDELLALKQGKPAKQLFNQNKRSRLIQQGIIIYIAKTRHGRYHISPAALAVLSDIK